MFGINLTKKLMTTFGNCNAQFTAYNSMKYKTLVMQILEIHKHLLMLIIKLKFNLSRFFEFYFTIQIKIIKVVRI